MKLVDAHCHLEPADYPDTAAVVARARAAGVVHAVVVGQLQGPGDFGAAVHLAASDSQFFTATLGIHPHEAARASEADFDLLERVCAGPGVMAVGEAGLDYYYDRSPRAVQAQVFARQCALATRLRKPLVVHVRDAHEDCRGLMRAERVERGVIHCFTGGPDDARAYLDMGFAISLSGILTYKKTDALREAAKLVPLDRLLVETDSPYLAPVPFRGKKNEPAHVREVAQCLADLRGISLEELAARTTENAARIFGFKV